MVIMMIGDVVGRRSVEFLASHLWNIRKLHGIDLVVANGENASIGNGLLPADAQDLFAAGVDVITSGNHIWNRRQLYEMLDDSECLLRPHNYPPQNPGRGYCHVRTPKGTVMVINLQGTVYMESLENPFETAQRLLEEKRGDANVVLVDFHAEATSEKRALAEYLDGRITALVGTHTHVATADERVLSGGTAFLTDLGMTGPRDSVLGVDKKAVIKKFLDRTPVRFEQADGPIQMDAAIITADEKTGLASAIERFHILK
ncbi:TIGR00282 family metallophosphoesterase [Feifania hominis]|uniref:TIGR00282 family metallophosphoesterase n=1 Tax=Feifania hominis TaxID=2763660 RepID=A0A926DF00_9FIRM|nr:TIGR00282 family metallophosphoesterase [Feifania hominis]MBC8536084.1 TIGR00282 family metallophosphoesterase [Feifania hominis]